MRGAAIYTATCAACHGSYATDGARPRLVRFPNWQGNVGTDQTRARLFDAPLVRAINAGPYRSRISVAAGRGYVAPPLSGIWATAPYLHNGSVPTLSALLNPASRPAQFMVGGHALDFAAVGIRLGDDGRYPPGYRPFSNAALHDSRAIGAGNGGHDYGAGLSPGQQRDLIMFLKTL
ncbi:MAG: c-type cytochrome [Sphingopyxis sp.]|nr:c-type cytochrome [Sphingopyxis sp.]